MKNRCFPKKKRLLSVNEFVFVFQQPQYIKITGITLFSRPNNLGYPRIGLSISKKYIKRAHERNRIKRCARETFRMCQYNLSILDFVLTVNSKDALYLKNENLIKEIKKLWHHYWR